MTPAKLFVEDHLESCNVLTWKHFLFSAVSRADETFDTLVPNNVTDLVNTINICEAI